MEDQQPKTLKIPRIKNDAIISIKVSGPFLKRCQHLLMGISQDLGEEALKESLERFKNTSENPIDPKEATLYILLALVSEIEKEANAQNQVETIEITPEQLEEYKKSMI